MLHDQTQKRSKLYDQVLELLARIKGKPVNLVEGGDTAAPQRMLKESKVLGAMKLDERPWKKSKIQLITGK